MYIRILLVVIYNQIHVCPFKFLFLFYSILLQYLHQNWDKLRSKVDKKLLQQTLRSFSITNDELSAQGKNSLEGYQQCSESCKVIIISCSFY
jgi:hypothetical protein